ncbi:MAG TPA: DUF885 domain-containing protein [Longimicrobiales bacterium]|nr:DUF885 domain-containing protein [Longimicrobiales bacterium]
MKYLSFTIAYVLLMPFPALAQGTPPNSRLDSIAESYFEEQLAQNPTLATSIGDKRYNDRYEVPFAASYRERAKQRVGRYLAHVQNIDRNALDDAHRITYDVFTYNLRTTLEGFRFPSHLQPLNQFFNFTAGFAQLGSGTGNHPFKTVKDYDDFLKRMADFSRAVDTAIVNMRQGVRAGVVQPRVLMEQTLPQLSAHIVDDAQTSLFYGPIKNMPATFGEADRARLTNAYTAAIRDVVVPAFRRLRDFVRDEYIPKARTTFGYLALPDGRAWYEYQVRQSTTTKLTPQEVHRTGLAEVERIHGEMRSVLQRVGFKGTLSEFFVAINADAAQHYKNREEMIGDFRASKAHIDALTDRIFDIKPRADYEIRPVEPFRERSASGGQYNAASPDGSRPGIVYINTYNAQERSRYGMESLLLHEGSPGHHFQISVQRELTNLPRLRRFSGFTAFSEGWGLYAESLGKELGVYTDPYQYYGMLDGELWRAIRLVLDTGIHDQGWTRQQAIDYAKLNSSASMTTIVSEVERFAAIPGQALAYKIGQMKIRALRTEAERRLGPRFDIKAFHRAVLDGGALPLDVLQAKIQRWIAERETK